MTHVGASVPVMREWSGCAARPVSLRAGIHPLSTRVLAMATAAGTGLSGSLSREVSALGWFGGELIGGFVVDKEILVAFAPDAVSGVLGNVSLWQCASSGGRISHIRTSFLPAQRIPSFRSAASITGRASGFNFPSTLRIASRRQAGFITVRCEATSRAQTVQAEKHTEVI